MLLVSMMTQLMGRGAGHAHGRARVDVKATAAGQRPTLQYPPVDDRTFWKGCGPGYAFRHMNTGPIYFPQENKIGQSATGPFSYWHLYSDFGYAVLPLNLLGAPVDIGEASG